MCLFIDSKLRRKLNRQFEKNGYIDCYKIVIVNKTTKQIDSPIKNHTWNIGWNISDRLTYTKLKNKLTNYEKFDGSVDYGIHVYVDFQKILYDFANDMYYNKNTHKIIKLRCYKKDFIAAGHNKEAVFYKVYLCKKDYNDLFV